MAPLALLYIALSSIVFAIDPVCNEHHVGGAAALMHYTLIGAWDSPAAFALRWWGGLDAEYCMREVSEHKSVTPPCAL